MLKVVIADDEARILSLIRLLPDWDALGMEVAGTAGNGLEALALIERELTGTRHTVTLLLPYSQGGQVDTLHQRTQVQEVSYEAEGIRIRAVLDDELYGRLRQYVTEEA